MNEQPRIYFGLCDGGPFNKRQMAHAVTVHQVYIDRYTKRAIPGLQGPSIQYPDARRGHYTWNEEFAHWDWSWDAE